MEHPPHNLQIWSACSSCWQTRSFRRCQVRHLNNFIHPRNDCAGARQQGWAGEKPVLHFEQLLACKVMMPLSCGSNNIAPSRGIAGARLCILGHSAAAVQRPSRIADLFLLLESGC